MACDNDSQIERFVAKDFEIESDDELIQVLNLIDKLLKRGGRELVDHSLALMNKVEQYEQSQNKRLLTIRVSEKIHSTLSSPYC